MANCRLDAARAAHRDVPKGAPSPFQDCSDVVHLAFFFDGTGNNRNTDAAKQKWSNIARLFDAARDEKESAIYPIYISGVGTQFNGAASWLETPAVWIEDSRFGEGTGAGGDRRLDFGGDNLSDRLRKTVVMNARKAGGSLKQYADTHEQQGFAELNKALGKHRLIKYINVSVFGFSRGAALARAFTNRLIAQCKEEAGQLTFEGYPIRFVFLGLFDTVASFGVPAKNVTLPWAERDLRVSKRVERCVHYVAGHELRFSFPVDLIRYHGQHESGWAEKVYPGVHSDVGGGYEPNQQGVSDGLGRVPLCGMLAEAAGSGARLFGLQELQKLNPGLFRRFEIDKQTSEIYRHYTTALGSGGASLESQIKQHMRLYYSAFGTMQRTGVVPAGDKIRKENPSKFGLAGMAEEVSAYRRAIQTGENYAVTDTGQKYWYYFEPEKWKLDAWDTKASPEVVNFFKAYVHDSKVDFLGNLGPFSYFRSRGVTESTASPWQSAAQWADEKMRAAEHKAEQLKRRAESTYEHGKQKATETYEAGKRTTVDAYEAGKQKASEAYQASKAAAVDAYEETAAAAKRASQEIATSANTAAERASATAQAVGESLSEAAQEVKSRVPRFW